MRFIATIMSLLLAIASGTAAADDAPAVQLTRADLESWLDGFLPYAMATGDIAGGVVVVVKDGQVLLQKGYGYADVAAKKPVEPERTLFRVGSVAKLVTHTAAMQLVEQGRLDLDADISRYVDFPIPQTFDEPVTLHHLMTHTAGFEELLRGLMARNPDRLMPLETYVKVTRPARIFPPGQVPSYCNYCVAVEGYIVQRVSGEDFDDYLDRHIFAPLGMSSSTFRQPLPRHLAEHMSKGYRTASSPPEYFELVGPAPAGSLTSTGADMARFMIAQLQAFAGADQSLLKPQTAQLLQTQMFRPVPPSLGMSLGFFERDRNGRRIREHGGDTQFFHSKLAIFIDDGVGIFMSFNSSGKQGAVHRLREAVFAQFTDRYFPAPEQAESSIASPQDARAIAGRYASSRRAETTFLKLFTLLGQFDIVPQPDGSLTAAPLTELNGNPKQWMPVAPMVWRESGGPEQLAAQMDGDRVRMVGVDEAGGILVFLPVPWQQSGAWLLPTIGAASLILLLTVIAWPIAAWRRTCRLGFSPTPLSLARTAALIDVIFLVGWIFTASGVETDLAAYDGHLDGWFYVLHALGLIGAVGALAAIWNAWTALSARRGWKATTWSVALALSCVAVSSFGFAFNLIRFKLQY